MLLISDDLQIHIGFVISFYLVLIAYNCQLTVTHVFLTFICLFVIEIIILIHQTNIQCFFILLEILFSSKFVIFLLIYLKEINEIKVFNIQNTLSEEIERTEDLLKHLMPVHVIDQLKEGQVIAEELEDVPIMFADIVGFTKFSSDKSPKEVIKVLNQLFSKFDALCIQNLCYKVCTIGDCYLAIGFNGENEKDLRSPGYELINMMNFAFDLIEAIKETNDECQSDLSMRIGIHVGRIIGGVSGSNIVRYDIYGPSVMIANKIESNGCPGKVNVSDQTKIELQKIANGRFEFEFNQNIEITLNKNNKNYQKEIASYFTRKIDNSVKS